MSNQQLKNAIESDIPGLRTSIAEADRLVYSRDTWPLLQIRLQQGRVGVQPGLIVWPRDAEDVARVYRFARARAVPVTPVGAGSGVAGGAVPDEGAIVLDLKSIDRRLEIDVDTATCLADAGWVGQNLEHELNRRGWTCGHFPSSMMCSTVGGWFAARSAGQLSTRYGKFDDRIRGVEWVFPDGTRAYINDSGPGAGALDGLAGSEGTLGVATAVRFRVDPLPSARLFRSYEFRSVEDGVEAMRTLLQNGVAPAAVRLYDPLDTLLHSKLKHPSGAGDESHGDRGDGGWMRETAQRLLKAGERLALREPAVSQKLAERVARSSLLILMFQGAAESTAWQAATTDKLIGHLGESLGEAPGRSWYDHRYDVSWKQSAIYASGGFVDTMEVAFPWSKLVEGYRAVRHALRGEAMLLAHFSHVYETGGSIYFTFSGLTRNAEHNERQYLEIWRRGLDAVARVGGTITHHHGVGLLKARWMADEWKDAHGFLRGIKMAIDPDRIANPGKLGL